MARERQNVERCTDESLLNRRSYLKLSASAAAAVAAGASGVGAAETASPTIDRFGVTKSRQLGTDQMFAVQWSVSDADGNLDVVEVVVNDGAEDLSFAVEDVNGGSASGWKLFQFGVGQTLDVNLNVKDDDGNVTSDSTAVTLGDGGSSGEDGSSGDDSSDDSSDTDADVHIPLDDSSDLDTFTSVEDQHLGFVAADQRDSDVLEVQIPEGSHYGTSSDYEFGSETGSEPSEAYVEYYIYHAPSFDYAEAGPGGSKLPGFSGTYGDAGWGGREADGTNGWSARLLNTDPSVTDTSRDLGLASYVYHADQSREYGDLLTWDLGVNKGEWHKIGQYVKLNTPGRHDGVVRGWVDDDLAYEREDFLFRADGYDDIKIEKFWFNVYHGGGWTSPSDGAIRFADLKMKKNATSL
jgi:hypothetical protein